MKRSSVTFTKNNLSALLDRVRHGETVLITDRNIAVATLGPAVEPEGGDRLAVLIRQGAATASKMVRLNVEAFLRLPRPRLGRGASLVQAVHADREETA